MGDELYLSSRGGQRTCASSTSDGRCHKWFVIKRRHGGGKQPGDAASTIAHRS